MDETPRRLYTSSFPRSRLIPRHVAQVGIALSIPDWWNQPRRFVEERLCIDPWMFKLQGQRFTDAYLKKLSQLSARQIFESLPAGQVVLLCWEPPNVGCHRRDLAEWFERQLGIEVTEWGFKRYEVMRSAEMPEKDEAKTQPKKETKQRTLF